MSGSLYAGSTPKYLVRLRDENGTQLDPLNVAQIIEVRIWIFNGINGSEVAKFYLNTAPDPIGTWRQCSVKEDITGPGDNRVMFTLTAAETIAAQSNKNEIQIEVTVPDTDFPPSNERIIIKKGKFCDIMPAKTS